MARSIGWFNGIESGSWQVNNNRMLPLETILSANFKRKRKMPKGTMDQLLYIAELVPELKLWLQSLGARHWLKRRILNIIADHQVYLNRFGYTLPLTELWQSDLSALISIKTGFKRKKLWTINVGNQPEDFLARAAKIRHDYWAAYSIQRDESLGILYNPLCKDGLPISPFGSAIYTDSAAELYRGLMTLIFFESLRMQLATGCGLVCPWYGSRLNGKDYYCCGRADTLWQVYYFGLEAAEKVGWQPKQWIMPECKLPKSKMPRKKNLPNCTIAKESEVFL
jgi:hypothetical protein